MKQQKGIALITILVMVALATILAASIAKRQYATNENTAVLMRQNQALNYAKSAEAFFSELLIQDTQNSPNTDNLQEVWAKPMPAFPVEGGFISGTLKDESGKFNLNSLFTSDGKVDEENKAYFERILVRVGLPAEISQAVIDWQDQDDIPMGAMGAESNYYNGLQPPYSAANRPFFSVEELKLVRGFEGGKYDLIEPYVSALPDVSTKININTAPALLLAALDPKVDVAQVAILQKQKLEKMENFNNVQDLLVTDLFKSIEPANKAIAEKAFDVRSNYFKAEIDVALSQRNRQMSSYLMRKNNQVTVYARSLAPF
ncbi:general secretion pathway protein GspK [Acinetobacter defluvii]|uniref:Type II secretion system protein K n=1 Tax=Acinetobacter defluvii TaxID=1871111 RepID=A0A2S2FDU3_9GAMM|nr:type II secretion system minor pseudopilin GspK [Acinetobacter defluvii]AWL29143.1 general secretion pathway protein GspK [Acinetobacter defluvii]